MITKDEFTAMAFSEIGKYPTLEMLYQAKDPRLFQHIEAIATMLAMFSQQVEVAQAEPFEKTRDSTVLADSAMRGIIPKSKPTVLNVRVVNEGTTEVEIGVGRNLLDSNGRILRAETGAVIEPDGTANIFASQYYAVEIEHTITESKPFYAIPISMQHDESTLCGLKVDCINGCEYTYADRYTNVGAGESVYHIEVDDRKNFYIRFGFKDVVGVQPTKGEVFKITLFYSFGEIDNYAVGDQITFETYANLSDSNIKLSIENVVELGENPLSIPVLRELSKYPSVYNKNAVYLGEFNFLIRSHFTNLDFLFVWNESLEEMARGADIKNINRLFVAVMGKQGKETALDFANILGEDGEYTQPEIITDLTDLQADIKQKILNADNGYSVQFYTPVKRALSIQIQAKVSTAYDATIVKNQIRELILSTYGIGTLKMSYGKVEVSYMELYELIKRNIPALGVGRADLLVDVEDVSNLLNYPEIWHFVSEESLKVEVENVNVTTGSWGVAF